MNRWPIGVRFVLGDAKEALGAGGERARAAVDDVQRDERFERLEVTSSENILVEAAHDNLVRLGQA
jgi:hypothetical protein